MYGAVRRHWTRQQYCRMESFRSRKTSQIREQRGHPPGAAPWRQFPACGKTSEIGITLTCIATMVHLAADLNANADEKFVPHPDRDNKAHTGNRRREQADCPSILNESHGLGPASSLHRDRHLITGNAIKASRNGCRRTCRGTRTHGSASLINRGKNYCV